MSAVPSPVNLTIDGQPVRVPAGATLLQAAQSMGGSVPTDKLVDVSPLALRMSSPFNAGYWLSAA